jgi:prepilin-type N-terminal cleavage/methylation domain-containing protein
MYTSFRRWRAFTLIELLVVVAIVALLISILMPSLTRAREQAKGVKCVANLKDIGTVMHMYFTDNRNWFPYEKRNELNWMHGFYYGGHPGRRVAPGSSEWWGYVTPAFRDTPAGRPFNPYLYPDLPNWDVRPQQDRALFDYVREVMDVYECPGDVGGYWNNQTDDMESDDPIYWRCGNSYDFNYHYVLTWALGVRPEARWMEVGNAFLSRQIEFNSSTFVAIYEDPFDSAQWNNIPRRGWHRQWNTHSLLFLDGHARNMFADATKGNRGVGWKTSSASSASPYTPWYEDPTDPDYEYRNIPPR